MDATVKVNDGDHINIQHSIYDDVIIFSIWKSGAHAGTYLKQKDLVNLIFELNKFLEVEHEV